MCKESEAHAQKYIDAQIQINRQAEGCAHKHSVTSKILCFSSFFTLALKDFSYHLSLVYVRVCVEREREREIC